MESKLQAATTPAELRRFGYQIGCIFLLFAAIFAYTWIFKQRNLYLLIPFGAIGVYLVGFAAIRPQWLSGFNRFWIALAGFLARYVGHYIGMALFTLIYLIMFAPVALVIRLIHFDPLGTRKHGKVSSYWHARESALTSDHYERQFSVEQRKEDES